MKRAVGLLASLVMAFTAVVSAFSLSEVQINAEAAGTSSSSSTASTDSTTSSGTAYSQLVTVANETEQFAESNCDPMLGKYQNSSGSGLTTFGYTNNSLTHNSRYADSEKYWGIDVSYFQYDIDWAKVKAEGISFAIIRVGYRGYGSAGTLVLDYKFKQNIEGAKAQGIAVGVYFYTQALNTTEAKAEADFVYKYIKDYDLDLPVYFDIETVDYAVGRLDSANLSKSQKTAICTAFCDRIQSKGYEAGIYSNKSWLTYDLDANTLTSKYDIWLAHYTNKTDYTGDYSMWQFTGSGSINGINARVDMDVYYGSLDGTSLGTVSNLTATPKGLTSVLTWDTVSGADGYQVCKYNSSTGKYTRVDAVTANKITVTLGSGNCGYSVRAYKKKNGKCYFGNYSTVVYTSKTKVEKAKATSTDTTVTLSWNEVYNADGYDIFWLNPTTGKYCYRTTVDGTSCVRENLKPGNDYTFKVRAYFIKDGETVKGVASDAIEISTKPSRAEKPTFVRSNGSDITLSWNAVNGATGYQLAVYDSDTKTYDVQTTIRKATTLKGSVKDLEALSDYRIAVRAYYKSSTGKYYYGRYSPTTLCTNGIGAPKNPLITVYSTTAVMTWDDVAGAISYTVYKITDSGYVKYKTVSGEKCYIALADAEEGTEFVVTSSGEKDDEVIESAYSVVCTSAKVPSTPTAKLVKAKVKGVQLSWSKIADADGYVIYRYDSSKDKYVTAKVVESGSTCNVSVNGLTSGKTYKFRVRAYKLAENGKAWSDKSNLVTAKTETVSGTNYTASASYNKAIRLRWSKVSDADGYRIYRYSTEKKKYITVKTIRGGENTVYTVSGLAFGKNYKFKIRAYKSDSSGTVWSSASEVYTAATKSVSAPVFKGKSSTKSTVTLRWNKVSGADGYRLYKYDSKTKKYVHVKTISGSSKVTYTFTKLKSGTTYYFKIKAFKKDSTGEGYSAISKKIAVKTKTK